MEMLVETLKHASEVNSKSQPLEARSKTGNDVCDYPKVFANNHRRLLDVAWKVYDMTSEMKTLKDDVNDLDSKINLMQDKQGKEIDNDRPERATKNRESSEGKENIYQGIHTRFFADIHHVDEKKPKNITAQINRKTLSDSETLNEVLPAEFISDLRENKPASKISFLDKEIQNARNQYKSPSANFISEDVENKATYTTIRPALDSERNNQFNLKREKKVSFDHEVNKSAEMDDLSFSIFKEIADDVMKNCDFHSRNVDSKRKDVRGQFSNHAVEKSNVTKFFRSGQSATGTTSDISKLSRLSQSPSGATSYIPGHSLVDQSPSEATTYAPKHSWVSESAVSDLLLPSREPGERQENARVEGSDISSENEEFSQLNDSLYIQHSRYHPNPIRKSLSKGVTSYVY